MKISVAIALIGACLGSAEGIFENETLIGYIVSRPQLSCNATGADFDDDYAIFKCAPSCSKGTVVGGNFINGESFYHSSSEICVAANHGQFISGGNYWISLRKEVALDAYQSLKIGSITSQALDKKEGPEDGWSFVLAPVKDGDQLLKEGSKVSCADKASSYLIKDFNMVECPPGCLPRVEFAKSRSGAFVSTTSICQAALDAAHINVAGGLVRYKSFWDLVETAFVFEALHYSCVAATAAGKGVTPAQGDGSGVYWICADSASTCYKTYCDNSQPSGKGWMTIQRKTNGTDFYKSWESYVYGFGDPSADFWFGLAAIRDFVSTEPFELNITMADVNGITKYAHYDSFSIGPAIEDYPLYVSGYSGTAGDSLSCSNLAPFSTHDHNTGVHAQIACPEQLRGGWWYTDCGESNLNGEYVSLEKAPNYQSQVPQLYWYSWLYPMKSVEIMMRPSVYSLAISGGDSFGKL